MPRPTSSRPTGHVQPATPTAESPRQDPPAPQPPEAVAQPPAAPTQAVAAPAPTPAPRRKKPAVDVVSTPASRGKILVRHLRPGGSYRLFASGADIIFSDEYGQQKEVTPEQADYLCKIQDHSYDPETGNAKSGPRFERL